MGQTTTRRAEDKFQQIWHTAILGLPSLLDPIQLGDLHLWNRVIMAPMTRLRGTQEQIPTAMMVDYYAQRASAGLIVSEGIPVIQQGVGYAQVPGIWSSEQIERWKPVTQAVHDVGGRIFAQIWHVGRISHPVFLNGELPVVPSAVRPDGHVSLLRPVTPYETPRALDLHEIPGIIEAYRQGARNAQAAGFDGVEIHGANGYLIDQFLQDGTNLRSDEYGGSIENRARLMLEVADAVISVWGPERVGKHLAPRGDVHSISDSNPLAAFSYLARQLGQRGIAFIMAREALGENRIGPQLKQAFGRTYIANERFTYESAEQVLVAGEADAVAFGQLFIANPDLPKRFAANAPLNQPDPSTFYAHGP
jgi:2,4-dienoyl-CoA reductase-like NADH-dependent reductase (Old Yellow Enzyme family)